MAYIAEAFNTAVMRNPACTSPDTKVIEAMTAMSRISEAHANCIVIVEHEQVVGLLTERDILRLAVQQLPLEQLTLRQVLSHPPVTIRESALNDLSTVLNLFEQIQVSHLPIVDDSDRLVGLISNSSLHQILSSIALQQAKEQEQSQTELLRQQSEAKLRASEQRYVSLLAASPVGIVHTDLEGICTYANERYCEIIGIEPAKLIGQFWFQGHTSDNLERINQEFEQSLCENRPFQIEYSIQRPDGAEVWVYGQAVVEYDTEGQKIGYIGTTTDISDRRLAESLLASQHKILERIAKTEPLSDIFETLLKTMESYLTGAVCSITLCRDGLLCDAIAPSLPQNYVAALTGVDLPIAEGVGSCGTAAFRRELVVVTDIDNDPLWRDYKSFVKGYGLQACTSIPIFASDQTVLGVFGIYYHEKKAPQSQELERITQAANIAGIAIERHRATQALTQLNQELESRVEERTAALQMSEERWQLALKGSNAGIWDWDITGNKKFFSTRWKEMRGFAEDEISDSVNECESRVHPDDYDRIFAQLNAHLAGETEFCELEYRTRCKEGSYIWILDRGKALRDEAGQAIRMIGSDTNITARKQAEIALQESERRYSSLAAAAPVAIFRFDVQLNCTYVNHRWCEMTGRSAESALGRGWIKALHPDDRNHALEELNYLHEHASPDSHFLKTGEGRHLRPDGTINWFYSQVVQEFDDTGNLIGFVGTLTDITERKTAEVALQESETKLQRITESIPGMVYRYILHTDGSDECTYVSPQVRQIFELEPDIVLQNVSHLWERVHPDDLPITLDEVKVAAESLKPFFVEERLILPQAGLKWVQIIARPERQKNGDIVWDGVVIDITDRKKLEQEQTKLTAILEATPDYIGMIDAQGEILWHNKQLRKLRPEIGDPKAHRIVTECHPDWTNKIIAEQALPIAIQEGSWSGELALLDGKGGEIPVSQVIIAHKSADGIVENFSTIMRDITDRKQAEAQLQRTYEELMRATRLKDEFLANMSHELRTPLNAILGMSETLQEMIFGSLNDKQIKFLKTIEDSGNHLLSLINDILDVAKIESGQIELDVQPTDICSLCNSSMAFIKQQALKKSIQIKTNIPPHLPKLLIDERRILQVLINLLNNAVKFTPAGGRITLEASHHQQHVNPESSSFQDTSNEHHNRLVSEQAPITLSTRSYIKIAITDTGIGIASEDIARIFQPFIQIDSALNRQYTGTGLGLSLVKQITELHGGVINLTSEVGVGSCFSIELPCDIAASVPELTRTSDHATQPQPSSPSKTEVSHLILLAEDHEANISTIVGYLEIYGYRFIIANNGLEAIALAKSEHPDLILMDIQMPIMDGIKAIQRIRQDPQFQNTPIIALTALAMDGDEERCLSAGANSYVSKPVKLKQLNELVQQLIETSNTNSQKCSNTSVN
jgi:PAS domain S-box-containing protein